MVQAMGMQDVSAVGGGGTLDTIASVITIAQATYDVLSYFAQDNGGPSTADWCASVGYNY